MLNVRRYIHLHCPLNIKGVKISYIRFEMKQADTCYIGLLTLSIIISQSHSQAFSSSKVCPIS